MDIYGGCEDETVRSTLVSRPVRDIANVPHIVSHQLSFHPNVEVILAGIISP